jgi:glycosyltransferase involved in cell wall biosynthesis
MVPLYALLAAPLVRPLRIPLLLWYTHWYGGGLLRAAERVSTDVVSVDRRSFPLPSEKVTALGHGIDVSEFTCAERRGDRTLRSLVLGRYSPAKGLGEIVRGVAEAAWRGVDVRLTMHGPASNDLERAHRVELQRLVAELAVGDRVELADPIPRAEVPRLFAETDVLVNNMRAGAPDKAVYEACASCLPALASNPIFDDLLGPELRFAREDPSSLADALIRFAALDAAARAELGRAARRGIEERHSVASWADGLLRVAQSRS